MNCIYPIIWNLFEEYISQQKYVQVVVDFWTREKFNLPKTIMSDVQFMDEPLLENLVQFCMKDEFQEKFFWFCDQHCMKFSLDEEEHRIEYTEYHQQYMKEFEQQIQKFIEAEQLTDKEFFLRCRSAQQTDGKAAHYLGVFLAWLRCSQTAVGPSLAARTHTTATLGV